MNFLKKMLKPPGADLRMGLLFSYKNILYGLKKILTGEIRINYKYGKLSYFPLYPYDGSWPIAYSHEFAIAAIVRNEGNYLREWVEFHRLMGCTKFYIYDNNSTDDTQTILKEYQEKGVVDWIEWPHLTPWMNTQLLAYLHALYKSRGEARWLALIDIDEFLFTTQAKTLVSFLKNYNDLPAIMVYWDMFGTSNHKNRPAGLVIENYTKRLDVTHPNNTFSPLSKAIVQPLLVTAVSSSHFFQTTHWPILGYDENRCPIKKVNAIHPQKNIRINHYYTKSSEEWNSKKSRPRASRGTIIRKGGAIMASYENSFKSIHKYVVEDKTILKFVDELKKRM